MAREQHINDLDVAPWDDVSMIDRTVDLAFGRTIVPVPLHDKGTTENLLGGEYTRHSFIGDAVYITLHDGRRIPAIDCPLQLPSGLQATYGQINALAGDFYGTDEPISDGRNAKEQVRRFMAAFDTLGARSDRQPREAQQILRVLQMEVDAVNDALMRGQDPSAAHSQLPATGMALEAITLGRADIPSYLGLAAVNWDHFGRDAWTAYTIGHALALGAAKSGNLQGAYAINAFADHFLEDLFAAGHLRTPRRFLHRASDPTADVCAKLMHDEDNAIGLSVRNRAGQEWMVYGGRRSLDAMAADNLRRCVAAVQASVDEVYEAYRSQETLPPARYKAWEEVPVLASARKGQESTPLFTFDEERRDVIGDRGSATRASGWTFEETALECKASGDWPHPVAIEEPRGIARSTAIAAVAYRPVYIRVYYQNAKGGVLESVYDQNRWTRGVNGPVLFQAAPSTPLAAVSWGDGEQIRVYSLNGEHKLQEYCHTTTGGRASGWYPGTLNDLKLDAAANSSISAFRYVQGKVEYINVYFQEPGSNTIREYIHDPENGWKRGVSLPNALSGTSIAAIRRVGGIRVYYQAEDLSLCEWGFDGGGWYRGEFNPGKAPARTPMSAFVGKNNRGPHVYWLNAQRQLVARSWSSNRWNAEQQNTGPLSPGAQFAVVMLPWGALRLYYQTADQSVEEISENGGGWVAAAYWIAQA